MYICLYTEKQDNVARREVRKLGMLNSMVQSDLTYDLCFKVKSRSSRVKKGQIFIFLSLVPLISVIGKSLYW